MINDKLIIIIIIIHDTIPPPTPHPTSQANEDTKLQMGLYVCSPQQASFAWEKCGRKAIVHRTGEVAIKMLCSRLNMLTVRGKLRLGSLNDRASVTR